MLNKVLNFMTDVLTSVLAGGISMVATVWGRNIIKGKKTFADVPAGLKEEVRAYLIKEHREDLIIEDEE